MATLSITRGFTFGPMAISKAITCTATSGSMLIDGETVANGQTAFAINVALDVSACKGFAIVSDQDITIKTNSSGAPDNTLTLKANEPYIWSGANDPNAFLLTVDVTKFYVANSSGSTATIYCAETHDPTP